MPTPTHARNNLLNDTHTRRPILFVHPRVPAIFNVIPTPTCTRSTVEFVHPWVPADTHNYYLLFSYFFKYLKFHLICLLKFVYFYDLYYDKLYVRLSTFNP